MRAYFIPLLIVTLFALSNGVTLNQRPRYRDNPNTISQNGACAKYIDSTTAFWIATSEECGSNWRRERFDGDLCWQITTEAWSQVKRRNLKWRMLDTTMGYFIGRTVTDAFPLSEAFRQKLAESNIKTLVVFHDFGLEKWEEGTSKAAAALVGGITHGLIGAAIGAGMAGEEHDVRIRCNVFDVTGNSLAFKFDCYIQYTKNKDYNNIVIKAFNTFFTRCKE
jgi:hypothetical protein